MSRDKLLFHRASKKARPKGPISPVASVVYRDAALPPPEAIVPPLPAPLPAPRHPQPWPLNETDIDLPFEAPSVSASSPPLHYIGSVRGADPTHRRRYEMDVVTLPGEIGLFGYRFDREQSLKLCGLLLEAMRHIQRQEAAA